MAVETFCGRVYSYFYFIDGLFVVGAEFKSDALVVKQTSGVCGLARKNLFCLARINRSGMVVVQRIAPGLVACIYNPAGEQQCLAFSGVGVRRIGFGIVVLGMDAVAHAFANME